jgi:hypothetical protein
LIYRQYRHACGRRRRRQLTAEKSTVTAASAPAMSTTRQNGLDHSCTMFCVSGDRSS